MTDPFKSPEFQEKRIIPWSDKLKAYRLRPEIVEPQRVAIVDIGSSGVKISIYDLDRIAHEVTEIYAKSDKVNLGLGNGMKDDVAQPYLSPEGNLRLKDHLAIYKQAIDQHAPDTLVVFGTEAMRRVHTYNPDALKPTLTNISSALNIPSHVINIVSEDTEAWLAAITGSVEHRRPAFILVQGGRSTELAKTPGGMYDRKQRQTVDFGSQHFEAGSSRAFMIHRINQSLDHAPFFLRERAGGPELTCFQSYGVTLLKQVMRLDSPYIESTPEFRQKLSILLDMNVRQITRAYIDGSGSQATQLKGRFESTKGNIADLRAGAATILAVMERTRPEQIGFSTLKMRRGVAELGISRISPELG